jgi:hypothetical protein
VRTTEIKVQAILARNWNGTTNLLPFIEMASATIDQAVSLAASSKGISLSAVQQELMERWLAAHFYCMMDPLYMSKSGGGASGSFQKKVGEGFDSTDYGKAACNVDQSGVLTAIGKRQFAAGFTDIYERCCGSNDYLSRQGGLSSYMYPYDSNEC